MNDALVLILSLSLSGTIVAFLLYLCKPLMNWLAGRTWQYYLWLLVLIRFILPFSPPFSLIGSAYQTIKTGQKPYDGQAAVLSEPSPLNDIRENITSVLITDSNVGGIWNLLGEFLLLLWAVVALVLFVKKVSDYHSFMRFIKAGRNNLKNPEQLEIYLEAGRRLNIRKVPPIFTHPMVSSPMLVGVARPFLVLPTENIEEIDMLFVFLHELTHYKKVDFLYKWAAQFCFCLHWFNPVVYFIRREMDRCCELSCDELVIKEMNEAERRQYGDTLLASVKIKGRYQSDIVSLSLNEDAKQLKERLVCIMSFQKRISHN